MDVLLQPVGSILFKRSRQGLNLVVFQHGQVLGLAYVHCVRQCVGRDAQVNLLAEVRVGADPVILHIDIQILFQPLQITAVGMTACGGGDSSSTPESESSAAPEESGEESSEEASGEEADAGQESEAGEGSGEVLQERVYYQHGHHGDEDLRRVQGLVVQLGGRGNLLRVHGGVVQGHHHLLDVGLQGIAGLLGAQHQALEELVLICP